MGLDLLANSDMGEPLFRDRRDAGRRLAARLAKYEGDYSVIVLGLPRGGIPVAFEIAMALQAPLDVFVVRKLGVPGHRELAMGAIASGGVRFLNQDVLETLDISAMIIDAVARQEQIELERQERAYRDDMPARDFNGKTVIIADDGLATGSTMRVAVAALRQLQPARIVVAVPVGAADTCERLRKEADEVICLRTPEPFRAVSLWYEEFHQTSDHEVGHLLETAAHAAARHQ